MFKLIRFVSLLVFFAAIVAVVGRLFFFDIGRAVDYSMVPALIPGDIYLFRTGGTLGAGDIAVCKNPEDPAALVVGRIIGIPGDNVLLSGTELSINGRVIQHQYVDPIMYYDTVADESLKYVVHQAEEKLGGRLYTTSIMDSLRSKSFGPVVVPKDSFFLLGDNRAMAYDSRNFGFVNISDCLGRVFFRLWAAPDNGDLKQAERLLSWL